MRYPFVVANLLFKPVSYRQGAEEKDALSFEENLAYLSNSLVVFELSPSLQTLKFRCYLSGKIVESGDLNLLKQVSRKTRVLSFLILDPACRNYMRMGIIETASKFLEEKRIQPNVIISSNSALLGVVLRFKGNNRITRSVNFEPIHYLQENNVSVKTPFVFVTKLWSTFLERLTCDVLVISPNDLRNYRRTPSRRQLKLLPLQFLPNEIQTNVGSLTRPTNFAFLGSTFNVRHNRESFYFLILELAPLLLNLDITINIYGVKAPEKEVPKNVKIHGWVENLEEIYSSNDVFLVPYKGGTGQQSKFFEPLCKEKLVIANKKAAAGFPYVEGSHYLAASSSAEFAKMIREVHARSIDSVEIMTSAGHLSAKLFSTKEYRRTIESVLLR
jgi:hypothetical protein